MNAGIAWEAGPANASRAARFNRAQLLRLVLGRGAVSRAELGRLTGLTAGTISNAVRDLIQLRLLHQTEDFAPRRAEPGPAARLLALDRDWYRVLAVHQGVSRLLIGATDISGRLLESRQLELVPGERWDATADRITASLGALAAEAHWTPRQIRGVGVAAVGLVDPASGVIRHAPNVGWRDAALREHLSTRLPWPVAIRNNVHAMAVGEQRLGRLDTGLAIYVYVGTGIGSGIVVGGQLLEGAHGAAGEIGHLAVPGGGHCSCGKTGCLETVAAEPAIARSAALALPHLGRGLGGRLDDLASGRHKVVVRRLAESAAAGDASAGELVVEAGRSLGMALSQASEILDPGVIIVNGAILAAGEHFLAPLSTALHENAFGLRGRSIQVRAASFGLDAGLIGAATLAMDEFIFQPEAEILSGQASGQIAG